MPGEWILLADDPSGRLRRLLHALGALEDLSLDDHALVGGLAVTCRLRVAHRATEDLDEVAGSTTPSLIEVIVAQLDAHRRRGWVVIKPGFAHLQVIYGLATNPRVKIWPERIGSSVETGYGVNYE